MQGLFVRHRASWSVLVVCAGCSVRPLPGDETDSGGTVTGTTAAASSGEATGEPTTGGVTGGVTGGTGFEVTGGSGTSGSPADTGAPPDDCNPWTQDCPEGQKCTLEGGFQDAHCVTVVPEAKGLEEPCTVVGDAWSGVDDCGFGLACYPVDPETGQGTCVPICTEDGGPSGCADPARYCWPLCQSCFVGLCVETCDPLGDDCPEGQICINAVYPEGFQCVIDASGGKQRGEACEFVNDCDAGLFCAAPNLVPGCPPQELGCCAAYCDLTNPVCQDTELGVMCVPWYPEGEAPEGLEHVGLCALPQ